MGSASITFNKSDRSSVTVNYSTSGWTVPSDSSHTSTDWVWSGNSGTKTETYTTYSASGCEWKYSWSFWGGSGGTASGASGTFTSTGLNAGAKGNMGGTVTATRTSKNVTITYTQTRTYVPTLGPDGSIIGGSWSYGSISSSTKSTTGTSKDVGTASDSLVFYTQPAAFSWGSSNYIHEVLTESEWNKFVKRVDQYLTWVDQREISSTQGSYSVDSGDLITANIYNGVASVCGVSTRVVKDSTLIKKSQFQSLADAINS